MTQILTCIDGSAYADNICEQTAWIAQRLNASVNLLHVLRRHSDYEATGDTTGVIGLGARSDLLEKLSTIDEERGRLDQQKGNLILEHGIEYLSQKGLTKINKIHRRGSLEQTIKDLEPENEIIIIGKRGEHAKPDSAFLGSNLEKVARSLTKPLFVVSSVVEPIQKFLIAYDGKTSQHIIDFVCTSPLLKGLECHLITVEETMGKTDMTDAIAQLKEAGFKTINQSIQHECPDTAISDYVLNNHINLLAMGSYSHSRIHNLLLGSTTASLIKKCKIPLLLLR